MYVYIYILLLLFPSCFIHVCMYMYTYYYFYVYIYMLYSFLLYISYVYNMFIVSLSIYTDRKKDRSLCILHTFSNSCFTAGLCIISMHNMFMIYVCIHIYIVTPFSLLLHTCMYVYVYILLLLCIYIYICFTPSCFIYHMCIICSSSLSLYIYR
jgi:hypothetical protein